MTQRGPRGRWIGILAAAAACAVAAVAVSAASSQEPFPKRSDHSQRAHLTVDRASLEAPAGPRRRTPFRQRLSPILALGKEGSAHQAHARLGRSAEGRPIAVRGWSGFESPSRVLVFGCIHGTECAATHVVRDLSRIGCPPNATILAVPNLNPDGYAVGTRLNGRGVDLNRNFPFDWRPIGQRYDVEYSGPHPFSELETRLAARLIRLTGPKITIWFHQEAKPLVRAWGASVPAARRFARLADLPFYRLHWLAGTAPNWQNHRFPHTSSFVVELPPGPLSDANAERYATSIFDLTRLAVHWRE